MAAANHESRISVLENLRERDESDFKEFREEVRGEFKEVKDSVDNGFKEIKGIVNGVKEKTTTTSVKTKAIYVILIGLALAVVGFVGQYFAG